MKRKLKKPQKKTTVQQHNLPISLIDDNCCQQVIKLHEPETPWHLHVIRVFLITDCKEKKRKLVKNQYNIKRLIIY